MNLNAILSKNNVASVFLIDGCARVEWTYDEYGHIKRTVFRDANGKLCNEQLRGCAIIEHKYDAKNNLIYEAYFDREEKP